jgi:hypothetical protein
VSVLALDHVQLAMPEGGEEKARQFYRDLLGIPEAAKPTNLALRGGCWFEQGRSNSISASRGISARPARRIRPFSSTISLVLSASCAMRGIESCPMSRSKDMNASMSAIRSATGSS